MVTTSNITNERYNFPCVSCPKKIPKVFFCHAYECRSQKSMRLFFKGKDNWDSNGLANVWYEEDGPRK